MRDLKREKKVYVGVDVSDKTLDVCIPKKRAHDEMPNGKPDDYEYYTLDNNHKGFYEIVNKLTGKKLSMIAAKGENEILRWHVILENTNVYHEKLMEYLMKNEVLVTLVNSYASAQFAKTQMARTRTDKIDSRLLCEYGYMQKPRRTEPVPPEIRELKRYQRVKRHLKKIITGLKRLSAAQETGQSKEEKQEDYTVIKLREAQEYTTLKVKEITREMVKMITESKYKGSYEAILTIPCVGEEVAIEMIMKTYGFERFTNLKSFLSFMGSVPTGKDSGTSVKSPDRISNMTDKQTRSILYMSAMVATQKNADIKALYDRLIKNKKAPKKAIIACMRKLLTKIYYCGKNKVAYKSEIEIYKAQAEPNISQVKKEVEPELQLDLAPKIKVKKTKVPEIKPLKKTGKEMLAELKANRKEVIEVEKETQTKDNESDMWAELTQMYNAK